MDVARTPRDRFLSLRPHLLDLHRALLEAERREYEGVHGRVSANELLQLALRDAQFAWLHELSTLIVRIDELVSADEAPGESEFTEVTERIRALLRPSPSGTGFAQRYDRAIQADPAVLLAHRAVVVTLPPAKGDRCETVH